MKLDNIKYENEDIFENKDNQDFDNQLKKISEDKNVVIINIEANYGYAIGEQWHDRLEFIYIIDGETLVTTDENQYLLSTGDFMMIPYGAMHSNFTSKKTQKITLQIRSTYLKSICPQFDFNQIDCCSLNCHNIVEYQKYVEVISLFKDTVKMFDYKDDFEKFGFYSHLNMFLYKLGKYFYAANTEKGYHQIPYDQVLYQLLLYINGHYKENLTLNELSNHFHVSLQYLSKILKKHLHITYSEYVTNLRMNQTIYEMKNTNKDLLTILHDVVFQISNHLSMRLNLSTK